MIRSPNDMKDDERAGATPDEETGTFDRSFKYAVKKLGVDAKKASAVLHRIKDLTGRGPADEDLLFDIDTGDVVDPRTGEILDNLYD